MRLISVSVKNYRGLRDFSIDFSDRTVLVGANNTCKTSLLEAMNLALYPGFYYGPGLLSEYDFYNKRYEDPADQIRIELTFGELSEDEEKYFGDHVEPIDDKGNVIDTAPDTSVFDSAPKVLRIHFASVLRDDEIWCGTYFTRHGDEARVTKGDRSQIGFQYLNLRRVLERAFSLSGTSTMQRIMRQREIDLREQQRQILMQFPEIADVLLDNEGFKRLLDDVEGTFRDFAYLESGEGDARSVKYEVSELTFSDINRSVQIFVHTQNSPQALPLKRQGSGTQNALLLALLILLSQLEGNAIVAIDEPELSLHPHAQRYLMGKLKEAPFQLIVATHSPAIAECFDLTELRVLQHREGEPRSFTIDQSALAKAPTNTLQVLKRRLVDAYFSRAVLLVEGDTEEGALLGFNATLRASGLGLDLDKQELTILNLHGYSASGQLLDALHPLPVVKILVLDNDQDESFYEGLRPKVDLLIRTPKTPAGNDFEGLLAWQSPPQILQEAIEQQMKRRQVAKELPAGFKRRVHSLRERGQGDAGLLEQLLRVRSDPTYFTTAWSILAEREAESRRERETIRFLYAEALRELKGFRCGFESASLYTADQLPSAIVELFGTVEKALAGGVEAANAYVLS